jgi:hypothetical protein
MGWRHQEERVWVAELLVLYPLDMFIRSLFSQTCVHHCCPSYFAMKFQNSYWTRTNWRDIGHTKLTPDEVEYKPQSIAAFEYQGQ